MNIQFHHTALERFLRYVVIDTQSDPFSKTQPSTEKQKNLGKVLVEELIAMGITDAHLDEYGYVYATIPATTGKAIGKGNKVIPTICFCSHMDTSPDCSGANVKPIVHKNYQGNDIILPDKTDEVIRVANHPHLKDKIGCDIVTASGLTLLGADNKAGVAAIMDAAYILINNPKIPHGKIRILFTPDEEIGRGVDKVDMKKLDAQFGYTIDGEQLGSLEDETFSADGVELIIHGVSCHPGLAKGKLVNAAKIAGKILAALPPNRLSPETTSGKQGFFHPVNVQGIAEKATIHFIIRSFDTKELAILESTLEGIVKKVMQNYPEASYEFHVKEQYRNMKEILVHHPQVSQYAMLAMKKAGIKPLKTRIRGGTDGSRLSFMGLPCPNIFAGEYAFHSRQEWACVQDMEKAAETMIHLASIWAAKSPSA